MPEKPTNTTSTRNPIGIGRLVDAARLYPSRCLITGRSDGQMVDFMKDFSPEHTGRMYLRVQAAKDIGALVGMVDPDEHERAVARADQLAADLAAAREEIAGLTAEVDAIRVLESRGYKARRKQNQS